MVRIAVGVAMLLAVVVLANIAYQTRRKPNEMTATVHSTLWPGLAFRNRIPNLRKTGRLDLRSVWMN